MPYGTRRDGRCIICSQLLTNPSVLVTSGHVFCFACISEHMKKEQKCPVSGLESGLSSIRRIY